MNCLISVCPFYAAVDRPGKCRIAHRQALSFGSLQSDRLQSWSLCHIRHHLLGRKSFAEFKACFRRLYTGLTVRDVNCHWPDYLPYMVSEASGSR